MIDHIEQIATLQLEALRKLRDRALDHAERAEQRGIPSDDPYTGREAALAVAELTDNLITIAQSDGDTSEAYDAVRLAIDVAKNAAERDACQRDCHPDRNGSIAGDPEMDQAAEVCGEGGMRSLLSAYWTMHEWRSAAQGGDCTPIEAHLVASEELRSATDGSEMLPVYAVESAAAAERARAEEFRQEAEDLCGEKKSLLYQLERRCGEVISLKTKLYARYGDLEDEPPSSINPVFLQGLVIPKKEWIVPDWIPVGYTTAFYGQDGCNKTMAAQQLATARAAGLKWLGMPVKQGKVFSLYCEDDEGDMWRRQADINRHMGIDFKDLEDARWKCIVGRNSHLVEFSRGKMTFTPLFYRLWDEIDTFQADFVVIDNASTTYSGDDLSKREVAAFLNEGMTGMAQQIKGAVLLLAHPSQSGIKEGHGFAGNRQWTNGVRSRAYMEKPWENDRGKAEEKGYGPDDRLLSLMKSNAAQTGVQIRMTFREGFLHVPEPETVEGALGKASAMETKNVEADAKFLELLRRTQGMGKNVSDGVTSGNYAPKVFLQLLIADGEKGFNKPDLERAMRRLFMGNKIVNEDYGKKNDPSKRITLRQDVDPGGEARGGSGAVS